MASGFPASAPASTFRDASPLEVLALDVNRFPAVGLARAAGERGGLAPCVFNAANEEAVSAFMDGRCGFDEIVTLVRAAVAGFDDRGASTLDDVLAADAWARGFVRVEAPPERCRRPMTQFLIYAGAFILVLVSVITVHEFGHFAVGKLSGIKVEEFAIGFGPKLGTGKHDRRDPLRSARADSRPAASSAWPACSA